MPTYSMKLVVIKKKICCGAVYLPNYISLKKVLLDKIFFTVNNWDTLLANYKRTTVSPFKLTE